METEITNDAPDPHIASAVEKWATGIPGFDEISHGGLPRARLVLISGTAGAGKTVFALQSLINQARHFDARSIFVCFEEAPERFYENAAGFLWHFDKLTRDHIILVDGRVSPDAGLTGEFDLSGLLVSIGQICDDKRAQFVVFDGLDVLLSHLPSAEHERGELLRIDRWCLERSVTCLITAKRSGGNAREQQRREIFDYRTDCAIELGTELIQGSAARTLRILKYRGSGFAANAFPTVITADGFQIISAEATRAPYPMAGERLSTGISRLDSILEGGLRRGTATLVSGAAGTSKTVLSGYFAVTACARGERVLFVSFDQSAEQIIGDLKTIGLDLTPHIDAQRLHIVSLRSWTRGPEEHLTTIRRLIAQHAPQHLVIDPLSALDTPDHPFAAIVCEVLVDDARARGITLYLTSLIDKANPEEELTVSNISTIANTWIHLTYRVRGGERNRGLTIIKSRGTKHSNQVRELVITEAGLELVDPYLAEGDVLMGSARAEKEAHEARQLLEDEQALRHRELEMKRQMALLDAQFTAIAEEREWRRAELDLLLSEAAERRAAFESASEARRLRRQGRDLPSPGDTSGAAAP